MRTYKVILILGTAAFIGMLSFLINPDFAQIWTNNALAIRMKDGLIPDGEIPGLSVKALRGSPLTAHRLMWEYQFQRGLLQEASYWQEIGAENGDLLAQYNLGYYMKEGLCGERNRERGRFWLFKAANHEGDSSLKTESSSLLKEMGQAPIAEDSPSEATLPGNVQHFLSEKELARLKTKSLAGSPEAAFRLYQFYENDGKDEEESRYWLRIAAQNDDSVGQYEFGLFLASSADLKDQQRARFWIERAAKNGNPGAVEYLKILPVE